MASHNPPLSLAHHHVSSGHPLARNTYILSRWFILDQSAVIMRKDGRKRSKAGLKFDFSGGKLEPTLSLKLRCPFPIAGEDAQYAEMSRILKANPELLEEYVKRHASKKTLEQVIQDTLV